MEKNTKFDKIIDRKGTDSLKFDFAKRCGKPEGLIPLWVADMDFQTSSMILDEIHKRVEHGIFGYTETGEDYFNIVAGWLKKHHNMDIKRNWLVKTPGVVFALAMAVKAYTKENDAVLIQQPVYYPFSEVAEANNRVVISNDLILSEDGKYHIDFDDFEKKIAENGIKLFLLCSPHNPVGRVWTEEELRKIADICIKYNVIIVSDEIHHDFVFEGYRHTSLINIDERLADMCVICTSPAKTFNLAGLQVSNIIIPNAGLRHSFKKQIAAAGYSQLNTIGIAACEAAYKYGGEWLEKIRKYLQENLNYIREYISSELPQIRLIEPEGTYLIWLDFRGLGLSEEELESLIVNKAGLWLDRGNIFGKTGEGFERINIATRKEVLKKALDSIKKCVDK